MKFSSLFACTIASLVISVRLIKFLQQTHLPHQQMVQLATLLRSRSRKQGAGKTSASVKLPGGPAGAVDPQVARQASSMLSRFPRRKSPWGTTGSVFQLLIQYLEKVSQGTGGAAGAAGSLLQLHPDGAPAKAST
ncbi:hypothetical protein Pst134EA_032431 [Puccinia striiformis f. sp. tritici]|uniref:uncharacterized protein n=1 Tax=Puccinia striiformis f. sp. tritici TaxID=168172 RepID=UPI0020086B57|nr:uncharacterized protein Pst134EA_032431 [Puccinia striiformis f. sp. tritici]KAH9444259.1 hypothetical protein Pst134EA_032431 [Puccinia striiformis f. sp. tritici]